MHAAKKVKRVGSIPVLGTLDSLFAIVLGISYIRARASASLISSSSVQRTYSDVLVFPLSLFFCSSSAGGPPSNYYDEVHNKETKKKRNEGASFHRSIRTGTCNYRHIT